MLLLSAQSVRSFKKIWLHILLNDIVYPFLRGQFGQHVIYWAGIHLAGDQLGTLL